MVNAWGDMNPINIYMNMQHKHPEAYFLPFSTKAPVCVASMNIATI